MKKFLQNLLFSRSASPVTDSSMMRFLIFLPLLSPIGTLLHNYKTFLKTIIFSFIFVIVQIIYGFIDVWLDISQKTYFNFWWLYLIMIIANVIYIIKNWKNEDNLIAGICTLFTWAPLVFIIVFFIAVAHLH